MTTKPPKNGLHTEYYDNGQKLKEVNYKNGEENGKCTLWYENGQKGAIKIYENNKLLSWVAWDKNGKVKDMKGALDNENRSYQNFLLYGNDSGSSWLDQQALTDDEKLLGEDFWRGIF